MTASIHAVVRALGHANFRLRGDGTVVMDDPEEMPPTEAEIAAAEAAIAAETVPAVVSARQARLALAGAGLLDAVEAAVAGLSAFDRIEWEYATEIRRSHPLIASLAVALSLSEGEVDELFRIAEAIV